MPYAPPTLTQLRTKVARDLRDEGLDTFVTAQIDDFINTGIAELNQIRPIETKTIYQGDQDFNTALPFASVFAVELAVEREVGETLNWDTLHPSDSSFGYGRAGWDFFAGKLLFSGQYVEGIANLVDRYTAAQVYIAVWGYGERDPLINASDVANFQSHLDEMIVRAAAKAEGMRALGNDRALFQQWQAASNNSDVSQTQMNQLVAGSQSEFDRIRKRHYVLRRTLTG